MRGQGSFEYNQCMPKKYTKKKRGKTKLGIWVLSLIIILFLIGQAVNTCKTFFRPWTANKLTKNYSWDGKFNINLVLKAKTIAVLSFNPIEKEVTVINFPDNILMDVADGFGQWEVRSVYSLGQSDSENGWELLEQTVSGFLGVPVDGFLEFKNNFSKTDPFDLVKKYQQNILSGIGDISNIQTSLTPIELIRLKFYLTQVRFDKIKNIDLGKGDILAQSRLNDGTVVYLADPTKIDSTLTSFTDPTIRNEHMTIAVFNATNYPQLAQKAARIITNLGGNVIITANAEKSYLKTQVIGKKSATLDRLKQIFDLDCAKDPKCDKIGPDVEVGRAQINIILGEDFYKRQ